LQKTYFQTINIENKQFSMTQLVNPFDQAYLSLVQEALSSGLQKSDRTGIGTKSLFGVQKKYDLSNGFPLLTTKKVYFKAILHELLWFLSGDTNIKYLVRNDVKIWNEWAYEVYLKENNLSKNFARYSEEWTSNLNTFIDKIKHDDDFANKWGELGPIYGKQWVNWETKTGESINQIQNCLDLIKKDPNSRRIIVSGWNVGEIQELIKAHHSAPPPCHTLFHFNVMGDRLDLQLYQRSADIALGVPFNVASYSLLLMMFAKECGYKPGIFTHTIGDAHIYLNHLEGMNEQLSRPHHLPPELKIADKPFWELKYEDFQLVNYESEGPIKFSIAV